jgi:ubiquinone/menaquinone biosynthesis C-methylase UbiE
MDQPRPSVCSLPLSIRFVEWLSVRKRRSDLATLRDMISPAPAVRLLDVGGGAGAATERFASGCGQVVVLEPDARKVAVGRRRRPSFRFEQGHGESIPFPDGTFDWVVSIVALHHMEDSVKALREMHRVLRGSGRIAVLELPPSRAPSRILHWLSRVALGTLHAVPPCHCERMEFLEPGAWRARLETAGFQDVTWAHGTATFFMTGRK